MARDLSDYFASTSNKFFPRKQGSLVERFLAKISPEPNSGCWLWCGDDNGHYGNIASSGRRILAHRLSFQLFKGAIPAGAHIDHTCRVPFCVNPDHLDAISPKENTRRIPPGHRGNNQIKTHCRHGHPLSGDNLKFDSRGHAVCRTCARSHCRNYRLRKRGGSHA